MSRTRMGEEDSTPPSVIATREGRVGHLALNRPRAINAMNTEMVLEMQRWLDRWAHDDEVSTVLLTGNGERGLCAGGDIVSIYDDARAGGSGSEEFWRNEYRLNAAIANYPKPYVAVMHGIVLGGGIGVSAHGSIRVVTETSRLGMPETGIGLVPDVGGTWLLARAPGELGTHLALTAGSVGPADAILVGLADSFVTADRLADLARELGTATAEDAVARFASPPPPGILAEQRSWIDAAYAGDDVGAIVDRLAAIDDVAARAAHRAIATKSPTALKATLAALRRSRRLPDLESDLAQNLRVSLRFLREPDLAEGIRAQVIDKDRDPRWSPGTLADVDDGHIDSFFDSLGERELRFDEGGAVADSSAIIDRESSDDRSAT